MAWISSDPEYVSRRFHETTAGPGFGGLEWLHQFCEGVSSAGQAHYQPTYCSFSELQAGYGLGPMEMGLVGAVMVDAQGEHLPRHRVERGAFVAMERQRGTAYVSNLAVAPRARRRGVARALMHSAEEVQLRKGWNVVWR